MQTIQIAAYYKEEYDELYGDRIIKGFELLYEKILTRNLKIQASNSYLDSDIFSGELFNNSNNSFKYFLRLSVNYMNLKYVNLGLTYILRPGIHYTPVESTVYNEIIEFYEPFYSTQINSQQFEKYNSLNLNISRLCFLKNQKIIGFISISNILNANNQKSVVYNHDYTEYSYDFYQKRIIYFGIILMNNSF